MYYLHTQTIIYIICITLPVALNLSGGLPDICVYVHVLICIYIYIYTYTVT